MVGCARTGSTVLRHVLNRSSSISIASETHFFAWSRRHRLEGRLAAAARADDRVAAVREIAALFFEDDAWIWVRRNFTVEELRDRLLGTDLTARDVFSTLLELYGERRSGLAAGTGTLGEKTPAHLAHVPRLADWFPEARFVHTVRDPRGIYASELRRLRQGRWGPKARFPWVPSSIMEPLLAPFEAVATAVRWARAARWHRRYARMLGDRYIVVRFEDLVVDPEREVRRVCDHIGVPFDEQMLTGVDVVGSSFSDDRHAAPGFDPGTADRWRSEVHPITQRWFSLLLGRRLMMFGYRR